MKPDAGPALHVSQSAGRSLALLDAVISDGPVELGAVAARLDMPASTALRHLRALVARGWLRRDGDGRYGPGPTSVRLALRVTGEGPYARLIAAAQPELEALVAATDETAYLAIRDGVDAVYVAIAESPRAIRHAGWVGRSVPIEGTAVGRSLTVAASEAAPVPVADNVGASEPDVAGISAPVIVDGAVVAALSVLGPAERFDGAARTATHPVLVDATVRLAAALGSGQGPQPGVGAGESA